MKVVYSYHLLHHHHPHLLQIRFQTDEMTHIRSYRYQQNQVSMLPYPWLEQAGQEFTSESFCSSSLPVDILFLQCSSDTTPSSMKPFRVTPLLKELSPTSFSWCTLNGSLLCSYYFLPCINLLCTSHNFPENQNFLEGRHCHSTPTPLPHVL